MVGEAEDGLKSTQLALALRPDVVLDGCVHFTSGRSDRDPTDQDAVATTAIIGLSVIPTPDVAAAMRQAGDRGLIPKGQIYSQLLPAIHEAISDRPPPSFPEKE